MTDRIRRLEYRAKLLLAFLLVAILPASSIGALSYVISSRHARQQIESAQLFALTNAANNIAKRLADMEKVSELTQYYYVSDLLQSNKQNSSYAELLQIQNLRANLVVLKSRFDIVQLQVYINNDNTYSSEGIFFHPFGELEGALCSLGLTEPLKAYSKKSNWCLKPRDQTRLIREADSSLRLFRTISDPFTTEIVAGYFIDIGISEIGQYADEIAQMLPAGIDADFGIMEENNSTLYRCSAIYNEDSATALAMQTIRNQKEPTVQTHSQLYISVPIPNTGGWMIYARLPVAYIQSQSIVVGRFAIIATLIAAFFALVASLLLSGTLTKKVRALSDAMGNLTPDCNDISSLKALLVNTGEGKHAIHTSTDEFDRLTESYNMMIRRIENLMNEVVEHEIFSEKQRFLLLQSQIKPHFLYNALDSINACAVSGKIGTASEMLIALSHFYRAHLGKVNDLVKLENELENAVLYLKIEKLCNAGKIDWVMDVDEMLRAFAIPSFTLQPIVENCIAHAMTGTNAPIQICISGCFVNDDIEIRVEDTGSGISEPVCAHLNGILEKGDENPDGHFGIVNVNERIRLWFGMKYGVRLQSVEGRGTTVIIRIPPELQGV